MNKKSPWAWEPPPICLPDRSNETAHFVGPTRDAPVLVRCTNCGRVNDAVTGVSTSARPKPGNAAICFRCRHIMIYRDDLSLRDATPAEADAILKILSKPPKKKGKR